jgi:hydrogenase maturation protease
LKTLILGLGNPILGDDGVGIYTVRAVRERLKGRVGVDIKEVSLGGLRLMEEILGYDRVIIVDAIMTGRGAVGEIYRVSPQNLKGTLHLSSPHDLNFTTALELGRVYAPEDVPKEIIIYAIEVVENLIFAEELSSEVKTAGLKAVEMIVRELNE